MRAMLMPLQSQSALLSVLMLSLGSESLCPFLSLYRSQLSMSLNSFLPHHTLVPRMNRLILQVDWLL